MQHWYVQDKYNLIKGGDYSITRSYIDVIWNAVAQPKNRFILWPAVQDRSLTKVKLVNFISVEETNCCLCDMQRKDRHTNIA